MKILHYLIYSYSLVILFISSPALAQWTNEPAGFTSMLDCPFNTKPTPQATVCNIQNSYNVGTITTDSTAPLSPSNVYKSSLAAGASSGGTQLSWVTPGGTVYNEMYVGLMWRTNPQFEGRLVGNKLFFVRGPGMNGVFLFGADRLTNGSNSMIFGHNTGGLDNTHTCSNGGLLCFPNVGPGTLTVGVWTKLEAYIKSSTTATSRDGIVRWWVNGVLAGNYINMNYGWSGLNDWTWSETWDGYVNPVPTVEWAHFLDQLHISVRSGGGVQDNPPGASGTVTGVTVTVGGVQ